MANMSYCRFQNTRQDLDECIEAIRDGDEISREESRAGKRMFQSFLGLCQDYGIIEDFDVEAVFDLFNGMIEKEDENYD